MDSERKGTHLTNFIGCLFQLCANLGQTGLVSFTNIVAWWDIVLCLMKKHLNLEGDTFVKEITFHQFFISSEGCLKVKSCSAHNPSTSAASSSFTHSCTHTHTPMAASYHAGCWPTIRDSVSYPRTHWNMDKRRRGSNLQPCNQWTTLFSSVFHL